MKLYNTLTKTKQEFIPIEDKKVKFYHCGPTVYWTQHIGNLRAMTMGDLIRRSMMYLDYDVTYVRNYTDVGHLTSDEDEGEDKMEKGAKRENKSPQEIADKYIKIFEDDIKELNLLEPDKKSKATTKIEPIIEMIQSLLKKEIAYSTPKAIYFNVTKAKDYPAFSSKKLEDQIEGAGSGDVTDSNKKHPADFALWFFKTGVHKNALQYWESPFKSEEVENGKGFPGWHIECSVIAKHFLGDTLDIHMGGVEHIPIHHPNEIAQSECANDTKFANYWLHNEHLLVNDKKMSKSEDTGYSLAEVKEKGFDPLDLRYFFLTAHYRSKQNFTWEALEGARNAREKLVRQLSEFKSQDGQSGNILQDYDNQFKESLEDDVNIPKALSIVWKLLSSEEKPEDKLETVLEFDEVLGLNLTSQIAKDKQIQSSNSEIKKLLQKREEARKNRNFEAADKARDEIIQKFGGEVIDSPSGESEWRK